MLSESDKEAQKQYIDEIAECLKNGHATVMVGAGFSRNADGAVLTQKTFPTWNNLADTFYEKLHGSCSTSNLKDIRYLSPLKLAEEVEAAYGRSVLNRVLIDQIPDAEYRPSELHKKLLRLPWKDIFTTNYDTLLERTCEYITENRFNIVTCKEDLVNSANTTRIIKLHGSFPSHRPFIITSEDYRSYPRKFSPFVNTVQQSLLENTLCLIGFSGDDPNFQQWIGWIHDNLGKDNSPTIYLIMHGEYDSISDAQKKLLHDKKVVTIDVSVEMPNGTYRECLEKLLDHLLDIVNKQKKLPEWPNIQSINDFDKQSIKEMTHSLRSLRMSYPGWIVAPYTSRSLIQYILSSIDHAMYRLENSTQEDEINFLFEYNWLRERCLRPLFGQDIKVYETVLNRHESSSSVKSNEDAIIQQSLLLALLRAYREADYQEEWQKVMEQIENNRIFSTDDQRNQLYFEKCMHALFSFDYTELKRLLAVWDVSDQPSEWVLRKSGLLTETDELPQAQNLLQSALFLVRKHLQVDSCNCKLLSQESALMTLLRFVEQVLSLQKNLEDTSEKLSTVIHDYAERRLLHQKYKADWHMEEERFELLLKPQPQPFKRTDLKQTFDFDRQTVTSFWGEDVDTLYAFSFLRFCEDTGHPFRIKHVVSGTEAAVGAVNRIATYASTWAVVTLMRIDDSKSVDFVFNRPALSQVTAIEADALCWTYIKALRSMQNELLPGDWFSPRHLAGFAASVFPEILSRLCCKCSITVLDELLDLLLDIYNSKSRENYKNIANLTYRLMEAFTATQKHERIKKFLKFKLIQDKLYFAREFPDPFCFFSDSDIKNSTSTEELSDITDLLKLAMQKELRIPALERLIILYVNGILTEKQAGWFSSLLWDDVGSQNIIPKLNNFHRSVYLALPHPPEIDPATLLKATLQSELQLLISQQGFGSSRTSQILSEFFSISCKGLFDAKDLEILLPICISLWNKYQSYFCRIKQRMNDDMSLLVRKESFLLVKIMYTLLLHAADWQPSKEVSEQISAMCTELSKEKLLHPALKLLWAIKYEELIDARKLITEYLLPNNDYDRVSAFETLMLGIEYPQIMKIEPACLHSILELVVQEIFWRQNEHLSSAINFINELITKNTIYLTNSLFEKLLYGLQYLLTETYIEQDDSIDEASKKGRIRKAAARLAFCIYTYYRNQGIDLPETILKWQKICTDPDEFVEIRLQWDVECLSLN